MPTHMSPHHHNVPHSFSYVVNLPASRAGARGHPQTTHPRSARQHQPFSNPLAFMASPSRPDSLLHADQRATPYGEQKSTSPGNKTSDNAPPPPPLISRNMAAHCVAPRRPRHIQSADFSTYGAAGYTTHVVNSRMAPLGILAAPSVPQMQPSSQTQQVATQVPQKIEEKSISLAPQTSSFPIEEVFGLQVCVCVFF